MRRAAVLLLVAASAFGQNVDRPVEETKKNIKVLKGLPNSQLIPVMTFMANSLGVTCLHCHGQQWESDEKPAKDIARREIAMQRAINQAHYGGKTVVTCNTCHRGQVKPLGIPLVENAGWNKVPPETDSEPLPPVEAVLAKAVSAVGGAPPGQRFTRGTVIRMSGRDEPKGAPFELTQAQPDLAAIKTDLSYPPDANRELYRNYFLSHTPARGYTELKVTGRDNVRGRNAVVVEARRSESRPDRLYFDSDSGLLLRKYRELETILGVLPEQYDFGDYRRVDGVMVPFFMEWSRADYRVTYEIETVEHVAASTQ